MSAKLLSPSTIHNLLLRVSPRYAVECKLKRLDSTPEEELSSETKEKARSHFKDLVKAELLERQVARFDQRVADLRTTRADQGELNPLLQRQLKVVDELYAILRRVSREYVRRPDGEYVRLLLTRETDELFVKRCQIDHDLPLLKKPVQDVT